MPAPDGLSPRAAPPPAPPGVAAGGSRPAPPLAVSAPPPGATAAPSGFSPQFSPTACAPCGAPPVAGVSQGVLSEGAAAAQLAVAAARSRRRA